MTLGQLHTFAVVARLGSLTAAARELGVSVPAVSAALASLRREFGDELVERAGSGMRLTSGGARLAAAAAEMVGIADQAHRSVREAQGGGRLLRLAVTHEISELVSGPLVDAFTRARPDIEVSVTAAAGSGLLDLLRDRRVDATLGPSLPPTRGVELVPFLRARAIVVSAPSHPLAARAGVDAATLRGARWLVGPAGVDDTTAVGGLVARLRPDPARLGLFSSEGAALAVVISGGGVGPAVAHAVNPELRGGLLVALPVAGTPWERVWQAGFLTGTSRPPVAALLRSFLVTPEATHAILTRSGASARRFRPPIHVTLWA